MLHLVPRTRHSGVVEGLRAQRSPRRALGRITVLALLIAACGTGGTTKPVIATPGFDDAWQSLTYGAYLPPKEIGPKVDVIFHFHAANAVEQEYRSTGLHAVVVSFQLSGLGTRPYWEAMNDPNRFENMKSEVLQSLRSRAGHDVSFGRIAIVAWSAGYASVQRILVQPRHYEEIDALILLDAIHTGYAPPPPKKANLATVAPFVHFARDAVAGRKLFVFTQSSIVPDGYASTREVADTLADELGVKWTTEPRPGPPGAFRSADGGDAHLRGWEGMTARDHVIHDHFIDEVIATWLAPRWR